MIGKRFVYWKSSLNCQISIKFLYMEKNELTQQYYTKIRTFRADFEQNDVEHDLILLAKPVDCVCCGIDGAFADEFGDNGSPASCWLLVMESACENGPFAAADAPSSVTKTLGVRFRPRGLNIVGISPSRVIFFTYTYTIINY